MHIPPWAIPAFLLPMLVVTILIEQKSNGRIPNAWVLLNLIVAVAVAAVTGAWTMLLGGLVLFSMMFVLWRQGVAGGGLAKLSLAVGALLGPLSASLACVAIVVSVLIVVNIPIEGSERRTVPGGLVLLFGSTIGIAFDLVMQT